MKGKGKWTALALALALCAWTAPVTPATAQEEIARVSVGSTNVSWDALVEHQSTVLTVSGPGGTIRREFAAGKQPVFDLSELQEIADGVYSYELRIVPNISPEVRKSLREGRRTGDAQVIERLQKQGKLPRVTVQSGSFTVADGLLVTPELKERSGLDNATAAQVTYAVAADQVIPDDLIVQGSACVGFDCVDGESFGFDTIRLKENNLRIKFEDTSTGTYPATDWQLTANDSASGGANRFSIEDVTAATVPFTVEGASTTNSIYIDSSGKVGFRTATPVLDLHVATNNTPAIRLEQNNTGGFTAQTWDIAGNEANFFVRDVTGGSLLPFRIRPGAPTSSIDIDSAGEVGIGTASPAAKLHVASGEVRLPPGTGAAAGNNTHFNFSVDGKNYIRGTTILTDNGGSVGMGGQTNPSHPLHMGSGAHVTSGGVWTDASSREFKEEIQNLSTEEAMAALTDLNPVKFKYKATENERHVGFIAEEVPDLVATEDRKGLATMDVVAVLTKVVKEQQKTIDELAAKVADLEKQKTDQAGN